MMENFLFYIGKAALAAGAFYLVYLALFQNLKQFTFNRIYLPVSLALSFAIPLITFTTVNYVEPVPVESNPLPVFTESFEPVVAQQSRPQFIWEWYHYLFAIYAAGTLLFLFRLLLGHGKAWNIIRKSRVQQLFNSLVNISKKDIHPFSFFSKIVLSENTLSLPHLEMIVAHESIHVKEKHTLDILFTEILFLLQWFNPFAWLLKDAVKNNLEYKTDHDIAKTTDAQTYQLAMLALAHKQGVAPFLTALNGSQLKNRIIMMKKKTGNKYARVKQLAVLPLLAVLVMGLANREIKTEIKHLNESISVLKDASATVFYGERGKNGVVLIKTKSGNKSRLYPDAGQIEIKGKVISLHGQKPIPGATIFFTVNGVKSGTVSNTNGDFIVHAEDSDVFLEFLSEGYLKKEFAWDGSKELTVKMESDKNSTTPGKTTEKTKWEKMLRKAGIERYPEGKEPIVIQDGYETLHNANDISGLYNPSVIKSIRYKKNTNIDIKRKELAKNGFIEIKTTLPKQGKKLYIIDGKEVFLKNQKPSVYIYPRQLQKMKELSKEEAVNKYGNKAKHGAFEITTKSNTLTSETGVSKANNPLIVVDGIVTGYKSVDDIDPGDIRSVTILKDKKAAERYGVKGKDGVIEITMKPVELYTELQLRKFIADEIRYPVLANKSNLEKTVNLSVKIDTEGKIFAITEKSLTTDFSLDEVVVVGYKNQDTVVTGYESKDTAVEAKKLKEQLFADETKRVINKITKLNIDKFKGKTVGITVKFILQ